jgi:hypothetical protein
MHLVEGVKEKGIINIVEITEPIRNVIKEKVGLSKKSSTSWKNITNDNTTS